ncbi:MAG: hypothetical protein ACK2T5_09765, partial [Anaerolineales bacterium]
MPAARQLPLIDHMGFFSGLNAESYDRQYSDRELVRRIVTYFKPHRKALIWVAIWLLVIAGTGAAAQHSQSLEAWFC